MSENRNQILVLALGNDIMGDDAAGLEAARELKKKFKRGIDFFEVSSAGFMLIDILEGYSEVLILDSVLSENKAGTIRELSKDEFVQKFSSSPHFAGLPEMMELAGKLDIKFPKQIKALVMGINETRVIREGLSREIREQIPVFAKRASYILKSWVNMEIFAKKMLTGEYIE
ncbi:MAG: hydrogenase maturation protease [Chlorobi bacterium]|nr:hydrogenase maturation protease [Chlorobiota bacterium]